MIELRLKNKLQISLAILLITVFTVTNSISASALNNDCLIGCDVIQDLCEYSAALSMGGWEANEQEYDDLAFQCFSDAIDCWMSCF